LTEISLDYPDDQSSFPFMGDVPVLGYRYRVGIVGATGAVGGALLRILRERSFPVGELRLFASASSRGRWIETPYGTLLVEQLAKRRIPELDFAFFAAGPEVARNWALKLAHRGTLVIDKSPYYRDKSYAPLIVPEVNPCALDGHRGLISNPNCTTIPLVVALQPLHERFGLKHVTVVTFQSVSGSGKKGITALGRELADADAEPSTYPQRIAYNVIPWIGSQHGRYTGEEVKMVAETRRIMNLPRLSVRVTCVRVPTLVGHGLAVHAEFRKHIPVDLATEILNSSPGIKVIDVPAERIYPNPLDASGKDDVFVGRIRRDRGPNCLAMFIVADNLRKGAATNAVQIAELLLARRAAEQT
jgi:aspartate-semialdehyde dehydrogenase